MNGISCDDGSFHGRIDEVRRPCASQVDQMAHARPPSDQGGRMETALTPHRATSRHIHSDMLFRLGCLIVLVLSTLPPSQATTQQPQYNDFLNESSVVLITGAAGFLGSELAMALHRVYSPKKIICVDSMDDGFGPTSGAQQQTILPSNEQDTATLYSKPGRSAEALGVFEFKRQRLFHLLQTLGPKCQFYRADLRPNIPDYFDRSEVPLLDFIFTANPDITHVVHLADPYGHPNLFDDPQVLDTQAVPRKKGQIKAGMMEALLEQLRKAGKVTGRIPHLTYASSGHVYDHRPSKRSDRPNPPPFAEDLPITTPSSLHGASKLLDEILAKTYHQTQGIYAIGLRFFDVYGPWGSPGTLLFDLAERVVTGEHLQLSQAEEEHLDHQRDYVYIDDAVDAMLAAMQFRPTTSNQNKAPPPVVINVGTGKGTTLRQIVQMVQKNVNMSIKLPPGRDTDVSISYASTSRAEILLGFQPQVALEDGLIHLLAWHHDRAYPYGSFAANDKSHRPAIESNGIVACSAYDTECLRGTPVFPCASECSHRSQCTSSFYDAVLPMTRRWTANCRVVLYTVDLDLKLSAIPSATAAVSTASQSHVDDNNIDGHCNLAFVASASPLVVKLKSQQQQMQSKDGTSIPVLKHGFWSLVPVNVESQQHEYVLEFLPKLSPGLFFGERAQRIIYCDPDVIIDSIPKLLVEASMQPLYQEYHTNMSGAGMKPNEANVQKNPIEGATAMLIGRGRQSGNSRKFDTPVEEAVQDTAYRMVRISVIDEMSRDGFAQQLDSSFIVHTLKSEDSRLFRCDVFGELVQWNVGTDQSAFEFILGLHDMWTSVIARKAGREPWWVGDNVVTIPEQVSSASSKKATSQKRQLLEDLATKGQVGERTTFTKLDPDQHKKENGEGQNTEEDAATLEMKKKSRGVTLVEVQAGEETSEAKGDPRDQQAHTNDAQVAGEKSDRASLTEPVAAVAANVPPGSEKVSGHFGGDDQAAPNPEEAQEDEHQANADAKVTKDDDVVMDDDSAKQEDGAIPAGRPEIPTTERDISAYDTWLGVLSSTPVQYFVRVVPSSEAGVVFLEDYEF